MAKLTRLSADLDIIAKLDDEPNDVGGLTAAELKRTFDQAGNTIKTYLNDTLLPETETLTGEGVAAHDAAPSAHAGLFFGKADRAELLAHTDSRENPHGVTAAQAGADPMGTAARLLSGHESAAAAHAGLFAGKADRAELLAHTDSRENPHGVTAAQAGADPMGTAARLLSGHESASTAHQALLAAKQDKLTGRQGQVVGFDAAGSAVAVPAPAGAGSAPLVLNITTLLGLSVNDVPVGSPFEAESAPQMQAPLLEAVEAYRQGRTVYLTGKTLPGFYDKYQMVSLFKDSARWMLTFVQTGLHFCWYVVQVPEQGEQGKISVVCLSASGPNPFYAELDRVFGTGRKNGWPRATLAAPTPAQRKAVTDAAEAFRVGRPVRFYGASPQSEEDSWAMGAVHTRTDGGLLLTFSPMETETGSEGRPVLVMEPEGPIRFLRLGPVERTLSVPAAKWTGTQPPYTQTVPAPGLGSGSAALVCLDGKEGLAGLEAEAAACVRCTACGQEEVTFTAFRAKPDRDLAYTVRMEGALT